MSFTSRSEERTGPDPSNVDGARRAALPRTLSPQLATLVERTPAGEDWLHEIKYDGYRVLGFCSEGQVRLITRGGKDWTGRFRPLADAVATALGSGRSAVVDGEVVALQPDGRSSFAALQQALSEERPEALTAYLFDLLHLNGWDLREVALAERKRLLRRLLPADGDRVRYCDHVAGQGEAFYRQACRLRLEGVVSKRRDAPYRAGRGRDWLKTRCSVRQELVIGGFTEPSGARAGFGALLLGFYEDDRLVYAGRCGTGFTDRDLVRLRRRLDGLERRTPPFADPPAGSSTGRGARGVHWVEPKLVCEVELTEWTRDDKMRHPSFVALREDKAPRQVVRERPAPGDGEPAEPAE